MAHPTTADLVAALTEAVAPLRDAAWDTPDEAVDGAAHLRYVETTLADIRRGWVTWALDEAGENVPGGQVTGTDYVATPGGKWERSYNIDRIVSDTLAVGHVSTMLDALTDLVAADVVRLTVMWSNLQSYAKRHGIALEVRRGEAVESGDLDDPHVGQVWKVGTPPPPKSKEAP